MCNLREIADKATLSEEDRAYLRSLDEYLAMNDAEEAELYAEAMSLTGLTKKDGACCLFHTYAAAWERDMTTEAFAAHNARLIGFGFRPRLRPGVDPVDVVARHLGGVRVINGKTEAPLIVDALVKAGLL